mgnify:CR=1 FL=1
MDLEASRRRIILALDGLGLDRSSKLVSQLGYQPGAYKIHDLWDVKGPGVVQGLQDAGPGLGSVSIFVDLKLKDIPNTVGLRAKAVRESGARVLTVHASGGVEMMRAAVEHGPETILAVTVLTSLDEEEVHILHGQPSKAAVLYQARLAKLAGVQGIVCSPQEVGILAKRSEFQTMKLVVPGIRQAGKEIADQKRVDTPAAAIKAGATDLVIGRPITGAPDPVEAFEAIAEEIAAAMAEKQTT